MKKLVITLVVSAVAAFGLLIPATASATPGRSCNPAPGHGDSGCHRVTAKATPKAKNEVRSGKAQPKRAPRAATKAAPDRAARPTVKPATTPTPAPATTPTPAPVVGAKPDARLPKERAPMPWWMALWLWVAR